MLETTHEYYEGNEKIENSILEKRMHNLVNKIEKNNNKNDNNKEENSTKNAKTIKEHIFGNNKQIIEMNGVMNTK